MGYKLNAEKGNSYQSYRNGLPTDNIHFNVGN